MASRAEFADLPVELFEDVVLCLPLQGIVALSGTCKQLRAFVLHRVYRTISLQPYGPGSKNTDSACHFFNLFRRQPELREYVHHVELPFVDENFMGDAAPAKSRAAKRAAKKAAKKSPGADGQDIQNTVCSFSEHLNPAAIEDLFGLHSWKWSISLLPELCNVKSIRIDDCWLRIGLETERISQSLPSAIAKVLEQGTLERLEVAGPYRESIFPFKFWHPAFTMFVGECLSSESLKSLTLPVPVQLRGCHMSYRGSGLPNLTNLKLFWSYRDAWKSLGFILSKTPTLKTLAILGCIQNPDVPESMNCFILSRAVIQVKATLEKLVVRFDGPVSSVLMDTCITGHLALKDCEKLNTLEIPVALLDVWIDGQFNADDVLPPHLEELIVRVTATDLARAMANRGLDDLLMEFIGNAAKLGSAVPATTIAFQNDCGAPWVFKEDIIRLALEAGIVMEIEQQIRPEQFTGLASGVLFDVPWDDYDEGVDPIWRGVVKKKAEKPELGREPDLAMLLDGLALRYK